MAFGIDDAIAGVTNLLKDGIDKIWPNPTDEAAAKVAIFKAQAEAAVVQLQAAQAVMLAEAQSNDPWTSRARPTFLYVMYGVIILCFIGAIIGIWYPLQVNQAATNINALFKAIPDPLYQLFGFGYAGYSITRSFDKHTAAKFKDK